MAVCEACGAEGAREVSGKAGRLAWLKKSFAAVAEERRKALSDRILDVILVEVERWLCPACATCGCCGLASACLADCAICGAPACADCSLPALQLDASGKILPGSDDGKVLCSRCNPPSGGRSARVRLPSPAEPLLV